jgi:hypothetical protein
VRMRPHLSSPMAASPLAEPKAEQHPLERTLHDRRLIVTRSRTARPSSDSAPRGIHPHIVCSRGSPTKPAPSSTPRVCALSTPGLISPTRHRLGTPSDQRAGRGRIIGYPVHQDPPQISITQRLFPLGAHLARQPEFVAHSPHSSGITPTE